MTEMTRPIAIMLNSQLEHIEAVEAAAAKSRKALGFHITQVFGVFNLVDPNTNKTIRPADAGEVLRSFTYLPEGVLYVPCIGLCKIVQQENQ